MTCGMTIYLEELRLFVVARPRLIAVSYAALSVVEVQSVVYNVIDASTMIATNTRRGDSALELKILLEIISFGPRRGKTRILYLPLAAGRLKFLTLIIISYLDLLWKKRLSQELPFRLITKTYCANFVKIVYSSRRYSP